MEEPVNTHSTYVEGIGDEVIYSVLSVISLVVASAYMLSRNQWTRQIHPESAASVELARERLAAEHGGNVTNRSSRPRSDDYTCPICLGEAKFAIETNCGHVFCGECIVAYWRHGTWLGAVRCPVCRQQVSILLFSFTPEEILLTSSAERDAITSEIHSYNRRFSGEPRPLLDYIRDLPTLLRHAVTEFFSMGGLIWMFRLRVIICFIAAILYFVSPLDIIPEAVFGVLGFLDDVFIFLLLAIYVTIIYRQVMEARARAAHQ